MDERDFETDRDVEIDRGSGLLGFLRLLLEHISFREVLAVGGET